MNICPVNEFCGGCQYQGIEYTEQLELKQKYVENLFRNFHSVEKIIGMDEPENYRNRMQISFAYDDHHNVISGYYISDSHMIVPINGCMLCDEGINRIYSSVKRILLKYKISIFDERSLKGCLRHLLIRSTNLEEYMVVLVTGSANLNNKEQIIKDIIRFNPEVKTVIQNINNKRTSVVLSSRNMILYGKGYITDELCGLTFKISANSFYQVNKKQTERLYNTAIDLADFKGNESLIDAYCGTGTIGLATSRYVKNVIGIESNEYAVKDAINNSKINKIKNIEFICDDAGRYMDRLSKSKKHIDAVIMDPPRSGSSIRFMSSMVKMNPDKIIYIS
jgi:23S rRNA (uracil1939-C5)-methyltransferase